MIFQKRTTKPSLLLLVVFCISAFTINTSYAQEEDDIVPIVRRGAKKEKKKVTSKTMEVKLIRDNKALNIISNHIDEIASNETIDNINTLRMTYKSKILMNGTDFSDALGNMSLIISYYDANSILIEVTSNGAIFNSTYQTNGKVLSKVGTNWIGAGFVVKDFKTALNKSVILEYNFLLNKDIELVYQGTEIVNGFECHKIFIPNVATYKQTLGAESAKGTENYTEFYRTDTGLLYRMVKEVYTNSDMNSQEQGTLFTKTTSTFSNYKEIDGVLFAHDMSYEMQANGQTTEMVSELRGLQINPDLKEIKL